MAEKSFIVRNGLIVSGDITVDSDVSIGGTLTVNGSTGITSATLLDAIKAVDGAGSGIDADLLDGQQGSFYRIDVYNAAGTLLN